MLAAAVGISSAQLTDAGAAGISSPGALIRAVSAGSSPLLAGAGASLPTFWDSRYVVRAPDGVVPLRYPAASSPDFFVSGYADGAAALGGTAAIVDEPVGAGRTVAFGFEPNFRAFTDGTQTLLRNAILGADPAPATAGAAAALAGEGAGEGAAGRAAAGRPRASRSGWSCDVPTSAPRGRPCSPGPARPRGPRRRPRAFLVGGGRDLSGDEHRWGRTLERALRRADVRV